MEENTAKAMSEEKVALFANEAFYLTFATRNANAMDDIWSARDDVTCIHPGWHPLRGRDLVMKSWRDIFSNSEPSEIQCENACAYIYGAMAYILCTEVLAGGQLAATNIFVLEDRAWKMIHHHAGPMPANIPILPKAAPMLQ